MRVFGATSPAPSPPAPLPQSRERGGREEPALPQSRVPLTLKQAARLRILDPACGSGSFLLGAYKYLLDWHLDRYFGKKCEPKLESLSEVDRKGVQAGSVLPGMTKRAVILAIGYPPEHATPSLDSDVWTFWKNRFGKMQVHFTGNKVTEIKD